MFNTFLLGIWVRIMFFFQHVLLIPNQTSKNAYVWVNSR